MRLLSELEKDALAEAFNLALGAASATFAEVVKMEVEMSVPAVDLLSRDELMLRLQQMTSDGRNRRLLSIAQAYASGQNIDTEAVLLFPQEGSIEVVRRMLGEHAAEVQDITELEADALGEIGNIIINSCMSSLADMFSIQFQGTLPQVVSSEVEELLKFLQPSDTTLLAQISMKLSESNATGILIFVMNLSSLQGFMERMGSYFGLPAGEADAR
jgi:chemotaxis protein CheC